MTYIEYVLNMSDQAINNVLVILDSLEENIIIVNEAQKILQDLLRNIPSAVDEVIEFQSKPDMKKYSHKLKLCSSQIAKVLPPLCRIIPNGTDPAFKEITHYFIAKLRWCLKEIMRILNGGGLEDDTEPGSLFCQAVDNFLTFLHDGKSECEEVKGFVDDLLCQALTIAKMAENEDYNGIANACRAVLAAVNKVPTIQGIELHPLKKDLIICALINLERKVNIACLRLFLYVTSKFLPPLKSIIRKGCAPPNPNLPRQICDIDPELMLLDLYFERVQLISNYAIGNVDCKKEKFKVKCSLASIEFLADFLLPAAESYYMDPTNIVKRRFLQFLTDECIEELTTLTNLLDRIVDTPSLFQVLQEDLSHSIPNLKIKYSQGDYHPQESQEVITKCYKVISHIRTNGDPIVENIPSVLEKTKEFYDAVKSHANIIRDRDACNVETFNETLDRITQAVEDLEEYLSFMSIESTPKPSNSIAQSNSVNSLPPTPYSHVKENGYGTPYQASTPKAADGSIALEPFFSKIEETPVLKSTLYNRTPYKSVCRDSPRNYSFDITEVLETLEINYSPEELEEEVCSSDALSNDADGNEGQEDCLMYLDDVPDLQLSPDDYHEADTLKRTLDINFLEHKIKRLTTNEL